MQRRLGSAAEAIVNAGAGFLLSWAVAHLVLPIHGCAVSTGSAFSITLVFTGVSLARSYLIRRLFNRISDGQNPKN